MAAPSSTTSAALTSLPPHYSHKKLHSPGSFANWLLVRFGGIMGTGGDETPMASNSIYGSNLQVTGPESVTHSPRASFTRWPQHLGPGNHLFSLSLPLPAAGECLTISFGFLDTPSPVNPTFYSKFLLKYPEQFLFPQLNLN